METQEAVKPAQPVLKRERSNKKAEICHRCDKATKNFEDFGQQSLLTNGQRIFDTNTGKPLVLRRVVCHSCAAELKKSLRQAAMLFMPKALQMNTIRQIKKAVANA